MTTKVHVDRNLCGALGICESIAPDIFEVDEEGDLAILRDVVPEDRLELVEQAVASCPTGALWLEQS